MRRGADGHGVVGTRCSDCHQEANFDPGRIPGARHVPRGLLEFWIDPKSPYHKPFFAADRTFVFYCAISWRSALATRAAQDMGLSPVAHFEGGFEAWTEAGGPVQPPKGKREG